MKKTASVQKLISFRSVLQIATLGVFCVLSGPPTASAQTLGLKDSPQQCSELLNFVSVGKNGANFATLMSSDSLLSGIDDRASQSWVRFQNHFREISVRGFGAKLLKQRQTLSTVITGGFRRWNGHRYPFYFVKEGYVARVRLLLEAGSKKTSVNFSPNSKRLFEDEHPASEIEKLLLKYQSYEKRLETGAKRAEVFRKRYEVLAELYEKTKDTPSFYKSSTGKNWAEVELPSMSKVVGKFDSDGNQVYKLELKTEKFSSAEDVQQSMKDLKKVNKDFFRQDKEGTYKEFRYLRSLHFEQAYIAKQLQIFKMEAESFSDGLSSPELAELQFRVRGALNDEGLLAPKDAELKVRRHMGVAEISFWFGRSRDVSDSAQEAAEALSRASRVELGLSQGNLGPIKITSRVLLTAAIPFALSWYFVMRLESWKDYADGLWKKYQNEDKLINAIAELEEPKAYAAESGLVLVHRFGAEFNEDGILVYEDEEKEAEAMVFSEKLRNARLRFNTIQDNQQNSVDAFIQPPETRPVLPRSVISTP